MVPGLLSRLTAPFVFVVGKGGVGKSTTASAVALAFADDGTTTHLISTDPAHSLGDLFEQDLSGGEPVQSRCAAGLTLEELDAGARARRWLEGVSDALAELVDRGTYLDREDVSTLLDGTLPGIDEVMAALRLAELSQSPHHRRVVVDTAPTGHALRLLDSGRTLSGWVDAFDAMAEKASAVAESFSGTRIRLQGEVVVDELRRDVARFHDDVLSSADFVVVTRDAPVVREETVRLEEMLGHRGHRPRGRVVVSPDGGRRMTTGLPSEGVFEVLVSGGGTAGCEGLRRWGEDSGPDPESLDSTEAQGDLGVPCASVLEAIPPRSLLLFTGKGGVGKTTCAAAYALAASDRARVLLLSLDPAGSLSEVLDQEVHTEGARVAPGLRARQLDAVEAYASFRARYEDRVGRVFDQVGGGAELDRRVVESLFDITPPGVDEIFALDAVLQGVADDFDIVVVDTAPTGHLLRVLEMPEITRSWARQLVRVLLRYRSVVGANDLARGLLDFAKRVEALMDQLHDPQTCGVVVVTLAERLVGCETTRLLDTLRERGIPTMAVLLNRAMRSEQVSDVPTLLAPAHPVPPVGIDALGDFRLRWRCP